MSYHAAQTSSARIKYQALDVPGSTPGRYNLQIKITSNSNSHGFELHRPTIKDTKLLFKVIKAIIIIIRNCAGRPNKSVPRSPELSAIDVTAKSINVHLVLVPGPRRFAPFDTMPYALTTPPLTLQPFLKAPVNSFNFPPGVAPQFFMSAQSDK